MPGALEFGPFDFDFGTSQGRSQPENFAQDELYALVLGHDRPNVGVYIKVGDRISVNQTADIGNTKILKARVRIRGPEYMPGDAYWQFSIYANLVEVASTRRVAAVGKTVDYIDIAVNLSGESGVVPIALVLKLDVVTP